MSNTTASRVGFVPEPNCGRGTVGILWQCLTTIFLCVYTSLHLNVPPRPLSKSRTFLRAVTWIIIAIFMPELVCIKAWREFIEARTLRKTFDRHKLGPISTKQAFFLLSGGTRLVCPNGELLKTQKVVCWINRASVDNEEARKLMRFMLDHLPNDARIDDRSKADILAKALTCSQALWVAVQTVARLQQRLDISLLETVTAAYILLAIMAYSVWFSKPYSIGISDHIPVPTYLDVVAERPRSKTYKTSLFSFDLAFLDMDWDPSFSDDGPVQLLILELYFAAFSGVHCAAWDYPFPTAVESWMWRVAAVFTGVLPLMVYFVIFLPEAMEKLHPRLGNNVARWLLYLGGILYLLARLFVLIEVFISIRSAPPGIYQQFNWSNYVGHIGS